MHGNEVLLCDLLLECAWCAMSVETTELDLLRLLNTGMSSLAPVTEVQPSLRVAWFGKSLSAYLASKTPNTPTRYARYGLQLARTLCSEMSDTVRMMLMKMMTETPWPTLTTMSAPLARQASTTTVAVNDSSWSSAPCSRDCAAASPKWHTVNRKTAVLIRTPHRIR